MGEGIAYVRRRWRLLFDRSSGGFPLAHHGIQRSGTNYLRAVLELSNYDVINRVDPARHSPRHKHCRWHDDPSRIYTDRRYATPHTANTASAVNAIAGYKEETKHVVIFRHPRLWLDSIFRWGLKCGWFRDEKHFLDDDLYLNYLDDWHAFYDAWEAFADREPDKVMICNYGDICRNRTRFIRSVDSFCGVDRGEEIPLATINKVRHSAPISQERDRSVSPALDTAVRETGNFNWGRFILDGPEKQYTE